MTEPDLSKFNNTGYSPGAGSIKRGLWYLVNAMFFLNPLFPFNGLKLFCLRAFGAKVGNGVIIKPSVNIKYPWLLQIGNYSWIGERVWIDNLVDVTIGNNVCISQGAYLLCGNHNYKKPSFDLEVGKIILEDGVWIGAMSIVCPGVTCQAGAVLAVGSVATKNLEAYTVNQGNPAKKNKSKILEKMFNKFKISLWQT